MAATNKKEMRKLLNKYINLMKVAYDNGLNMQIDTRFCDTDEPWFTGHVWEEGSSFVKEEDADRVLFFKAYDHFSAEDHSAELSAVEKFIEEHKK